MLSKSQALIVISVFFALGILLASAYDFSRVAVYFYLLLFILLFMTAFLKGKYFGAQAALFLFVLGLGALRLQMAEVPSQFLEVLNQQQTYEGLVVEEPDIRQNHQLITFLPDGFSQNILLTTTKAQSFFYGDRLVVSGKMVEAKAFDDFDYPKYLERYNIYALSRYPKILILKSGQANEIKFFLLKIKTSFAKKINRLFTEPQGGLLLGILVGAKKTLPPNILDSFNTTGLSHIVAVSGFNITIIIAALMITARILGRRASFFVTLIFICAFVVIAGASASVIRAGLMGFLLLGAFNTGRQYSVVPALFFSALIMLSANPKILFWDVGFQLSFAATLGIIFFVPPGIERLAGLADFFGAKQLLITTLSAIVATLPLTLLYFGRLSLVAPLANLLILPILPFIMLFGFLSVLPFLGTGFAYLSGHLLAYVLWAVKILSSFKYASLELHLGAVSFWVSVSAVFLLYYFLKPKKLTVDEKAAL